MAQRHMKGSFGCRENRGKQKETKLLSNIFSHSHLFTEKENSAELSKREMT